MKIEDKPIAEIRRRDSDEQSRQFWLAQGVAPWLAQVLSSRLGHDSDAVAQALLTPSLALLADPEAIPDMTRAVARIAKAIVEGEAIIFAVDHDLDGQASAAVLWSAFVDYFKVDPALLGVVTSHRLTEGYGITEPVVERILQSQASLIISADKGSSDEPRIHKLQLAGRDVIVTDHHTIPSEGPPKSAYAVVNPTRQESHYDPFVCGAAVAFLTMAKLRSYMLENNLRQQIPSLSTLLDYVAVATIADCVALRPDKSPSNRVFVKYGLRLLNSGKRACWQVFKEQLNGPISAESIAFQLAPPIAAAGRLDWAEAGFRFLTATDRASAARHWSVLQQENQQRKTIEAELRRRALQQVTPDQGQSIVLYLEDGHSGVHGITASRLVETFGKPVAIFSPKPIATDDPSGEASVASGSFRGIPDFNVRQALQIVDERHPGLLLGFGGHVGAAGASIEIANFERFAAAFEQATREQLGQRELMPTLWVDGSLEKQYINLHSVDQLLDLEPWGKDFPYPNFYGEFRVASINAIGDGTHLRLQLEQQGQVYNAIWFNALPSAEASCPLQAGDTAGLIYQLKDNWFRGERTLQLNILSIADSAM